MKDDEIKWNMHFGADPVIFERAEELRARMTPAEEILWNAIKINEWHLKFRRQHPVFKYIADLYCHSVKFVIELDGGYHENREIKIYDNARENEIKQFGITVLRFKNEEVINNIQLVITKIGEAINLIKKSTQEKADSPNNFPLGDGGKLLQENADTPNNSPLGDGGNPVDKLLQENADTSNNSPLGDGGKPLQENADTPNNSPLGDGGNPIGKLFVIKIGGNIIDDPSALQRFLQDFSSINAKKILVHGGGKIATKIGEQLGVKPQYVNGRRITDAATIDLVTMVYAGLINKKIVASLQSFDCNAIGLTGADANIIPAVKRPVKEIDYGFVGDPGNEQSTISNLQLFMEHGLNPVLAPLTHDGQGQMLNTNADTIASHVATELAKTYDVRLIYCFEKKGVLSNIDDEGSVISLITKESYRKLLEENKLADGILPKMENAFAAIGSGVQEVLIGHAEDLLQNVSDHTIGTLIRGQET